jgi:hypothetical protein
VGIGKEDERVVGVNEWWLTAMSHSPNKGEVTGSSQYSTLSKRRPHFFKTTKIYKEQKYDHGS